MADTSEKVTYSEATQRTFEKALEILANKVDATQLSALRELLAQGEIHHANSFVAALTGSGP